MKEVKALKKYIVSELEKNKAVDVVVIDLEGKSDSCDYMVIATGTSGRHITSIAEKLIYELKHYKNEIEFRVEGKEEGKWILVDLYTIVVHLFIPE